MGRKISNKLSFGQGLNDVPNAVYSPGYVDWYSMIRRAYSPVYHENKPGYKDVEVWEGWKRLSGFLPWHAANHVEGWQLDKDILGDGTLYSPETCCFVPGELNSVLIGQRQRNALPVGVYYKKANNRYCAQYSSSVSGRKTVYLGLFDDPVIAAEAYRVAKSQHIRELTEKYKTVLPERVYNKLSQL